MSDHNPYKALDHSASLKGLLKPFKGKGDHVLLQQQARDIKLGLRALMRDLMARVNRPPYSLLDLALWEQQSSWKATETWHLRWRNQSASAVGVRHWIAAVENRRTPAQLLPELLEFERERITLNAQMSMAHHIYRQARECELKFEDAEQEISQRQGKE